jgi:hypothetical protein
MRSPVFGAKCFDRKLHDMGRGTRTQTGQNSSRCQVAPERILGDRVDAVMLLYGALVKSLGQVVLDPQIESRGDATTK